ncbi:MAG TPA: M56 family metallopeptidase [Thermoanaerobaculia bacterium]|nr:M56 family metallopeptidase [Thermoanaerobaculia bacterium]
MPEALPVLLIQSAAAAVLAAALVRLWKVTDPLERLRFWLLALVLPPVLGPVLSSAAVFRDGPAFREHLALVDASRFRDLVLLGIPLDLLAVGVAALAGLALFLRDFLPLLARRADAGVAAASPGAERLVGARVAAHAARFGFATPDVVVTGEDDPHLHCRGLRQPTVVVSEGALRMLSPGELDAALAHEVAHAAWQHVLLGWVLMAARALVVWNPVAQVLGRTAVLELERAADDAAIGATGRPEDLATALAKLEGVTLSRDLPGTTRPAAAHGRLSRLSGELPAASPLRGLRVSLVGAAIAALVFFVV